MKSVLMSAYWPNLHYFYYVLNSEDILIEQFDHYQKQSFRNRTQILTANGVLNLTIPVVHSATKMLMKDVEINYKENWQIKHWRAITSAYKNSPYFDFFETEIADFYLHEEQFLFQYNLKQLELVLKLLRVSKKIAFSESFQLSYTDKLDKRFHIHPKIFFANDLEVDKHLENKYYQTFGSKFGHIPNLSVLDLLFNEGKNTLDYLGCASKK